MEPLVRKFSVLIANEAERNMTLVRKTYEACGFSQHGFSFEDVAYILVGAYVFDYGGLALSKAGFSVVAKEPGGNYVFAGFEGEVDLRARWQWLAADRPRPVDLLHRLEYVYVDGGARYPVGAEMPRKQTAAVMSDLQARIVENVVRLHWAHIEQEYARTAPARNGVDIRETFAMIYHAIFEQASRQLLEQGVLPWPRWRRDGARYAVWSDRM